MFMSVYYLDLRVLVNSCWSNKSCFCEQILLRKKEQEVPPKNSSCLLKIKLKLYLAAVVIPGAVSPVP